MEKRKRPSTASRLQSVDRFTEEGRDVQSREAGYGGNPRIRVDLPLPSQSSPFFGRGNGDPHSTEAGGGDGLDLPIPTEASNLATATTFMSLFQGASNFQISNTNITAIDGNAMIFQFGGEYA